VKARTCASCRKADDPEHMVRWVLGPEGQVVPDLLGRSFGRGAWTHTTRDCLRALPHALSRSFRQEVKGDRRGLLELLSLAAEHRAVQLLGSVRREGCLALGATPVQAAVKRGDAKALVVARDAQAAASLPEVEQMVRAGQAVAWGTKERLGALCGRPEIAVLAILDQRLAQRLFGAIAMALRASDAAFDATPEVRGKSRSPHGGHSEVE
jgi:predicted RNA-binding protein YlxR (DUF448 family)/ribosomal protein L30E